MSTTLYLALDFASGQEANAFLNENQLQGVPVKVGMELFYKEGPMLIEKLQQNNHPIFLDLKLHDIPTTVRRSMRNIATLGVDIVNIHAAGGSEMVQAAKEGLLEGSPQDSVPKLLAVTVLTSMEDKTLAKELLVSSSVSDTVLHYAAMAKEHGADGVVCSALETKAIKEICGAEFLAVTPGIRLKNTDANDQRRTATPGKAKSLGADVIVVGRSITEAAYPREAYAQAVKEWTDGNKI